MVGLFPEGKICGTRQRERCWGVLATQVSPGLLMDVSGGGKAEEEEEEHH